MPSRLPSLAPARRSPLRRAPAALVAATCASLALAPAHAQDLTIPPGTTVTYDTDFGELSVRRLVIQQGGTLRIAGARPFTLSASEVVIDGTLDVSGDDSIGVATLNTTNQPEFGARGVAGGGDGGTGSGQTFTSTPIGQNGWASFNTSSISIFNGGGGGGETSYALGNRENRRGAGGGGGALAANQPVANDPLDPANVGLVATPGFDGSANGTGAISGNSPAAGGLAGRPIFVDASPENDFWGRQVVPGGIVLGEAGRPAAGRGGGAGGDAVRSATFPLNPFTPTGDEKGAGGGAGGGLALVLARRIVIGPQGRIVADGGDGGGGENFLFFDRIGGGSGGGSGGWIVLEALEFDLQNAGDDAISALGGMGGVGRNDVNDVVGAGGNGGPGVVQLHTPSGTGAEILLPAGKVLDDLTAPDGIVLLPIL